MSVMATGKTDLGRGPFNPDPNKPSVIEMRLKEGEYTEVAAAFGEDVLDTELPFPVRVAPQ